MKKVILFFVVAMAFAACTKKAEQAPVSDSVKTDSVAAAPADSVKADSVKADTTKVK